MHRGVLVVVACALCSALCSAAAQAAGAPRTRYSFFRSLGHRQEGRRVFGGAVTDPATWPAACALLDRSLATRCSCSVLTPRWALTAAHCVTPFVSYVQYNSVNFSTSSFETVKNIYAHPMFEAVMGDLGYGVDIVKLQHDVGLVGTRSDMLVARVAGRSSPTIDTMSKYNIEDLIGKEIEVLGFGMTEAEPAGDRLRTVRLQLVSCDRQGWQNCACALGEASGVCSGDSGGPVLYNGTQIGVTSLGPDECAVPFASQQMVMSAFTVLRPYAPIVDATMRDLESALRMRRIQTSSARRVKARAAFAVALVLLCSGW